MQEQSGKFSKEIQTINNQTSNPDRNLTTKNTVTELENSIERFNNRLDQVPPLGPHKKKSE